MFITILATIFVIGLLVLVHEYGHFLVARRLGVKVEIFSIGFGPKILSFPGRETEYRISLIPLGGYVKLYGEHPDLLPSLVEKEKAFAFKRPWQKALIVIAGPLANFIFAFLIFWFSFSLVGQVFTPSKIEEVLPNSPAEKAGLKKGDEILSINNKKVESFEELLLELRKDENPKEIVLKINRKGEILETKVVPEFMEGTNIFGKKTKVPFLGIKATSEQIHKKLNPFSAFIVAGKKVYGVTVLTFTAIYKLFTGEIPFSTLGGPLTIGKFAGDSARLGLLAFFTFVALLSINLGVINVLPLPMLDGGHLVLFGIEAIQGKPLSLKTQELIFKVGLILIIVLSIAVFYNDILRVMSGWKNP